MTLATPNRARANRPFWLPMVRGALTAAALALTAVIAMPGPASAQSVLLFVNGDPITNFDVAQRTRLIQISSNRSPSRKEVIQELIDERLKVQLLKRFNIPGIDKEVDNTVAGMARRSGMSTSQFLEQLGRANVGEATLKSRIKAEMIWNQIVRSRYKASFEVSDSEIRAKLQEKHPDGSAPTGYDYTLRPIVFVVPRGANDGLRATRRREAEAFRSRFQSCDQGIRLARTMREVAVRPPVVRSSADLPEALQKILAQTPVGRATAPENTEHGITVYAVCNKQTSGMENAPIRREIREQIASTRFDAKSEAFLQELRSQAMIEYR